MKLAHAIIGGGFLGFVLAHANISICTWQFWVIILGCNLWYWTKPNETIE